MLSSPSGLMLTRRFLKQRHGSFAFLDHGKAALVCRPATVQACRKRWIGADYLCGRRPSGECRVSNQAFKVAYGGTHHDWAYFKTNLSFARLVT